MEHFDVVVIGSGPGGYVSAIRCAQLGMKTAIVEKYNTLGGTCLNVGCIPSKSLLDSSHHYHEAVHNFSTHGIEIDGTIKVDLNKMISRKDSVVDQTTKGIDYLMSKNKIKVFNGIGAFEDNQTITINSSDKIKFSNAIIATGSKPISLPFAKIDKKRVISSTEALKLKEIPKKLIVIGGGVIGLELGQVYNRLGSEVSVIEYSNKITPFMDGAVSKELLRIFKKQKIKFYLSHKVISVKSENNSVSVTAEDSNGTNVSFEGDYCLVSVGRKPYTDGLNLDSLGINTNQKGQIEVNDKLQTSVENIYAIGDVIKGPMLAHKAEEEGVLVAEILAKQKPHINYNLIPNVIYTWPEVASVGKTQEQLLNEGIEFKTGQFPMRALGRSRASMDIDGFVKILADKKTDEILGVHIIGARAADLIAEAVTAMEFRASAEDISRMSHSHPTYAEAIKEAALAATDNRPLHI
ncbi:dihydrolipoyl dehydrogenase [Flavobacteriaceae bacterium]|jgi:dihydrolipoamide dehydrogenase|nr:dihydrolipoyl dehydrogenase [Flavobacteriaceae bacterium]MDB4148224.1 dihydrolipoyl dehydrogenase [Flavobacteriaceae bacterium]MDB4164376.1 dihydrolipoyl dehydrogenase [Flavobacteriaceae bacterium]MDB9853338.1 dihydrolipoyl dehydrogenase [Flavobacteriaceae bacterium]MDC1396322.1 dihydrolipoyl dehydrogenase [Flavobacteriaceae bacterium]|tara:strand:- start:15580 stop:16974 length:1395 start_codon:yes stop_codon:yes gene_type:complete